MGPGLEGLALTLQRLEFILEISICHRTPQVLLPQVRQSPVDTLYFQGVIGLGSLGGQGSKHCVSPFIVQGEVGKDSLGELSLHPRRRHRLRLHPTAVPAMLHARIQPPFVSASHPVEGLATPVTH